jgi:hypothetical protein
MRKNFTNRVYPALLFLLLLPLLLSGCQQGFFHGIKNIFSSDADTEKVAIDNPRPEEKDIQVVTPVRETTAPEPALSYEEKILSDNQPAESRKPNPPGVPGAIPLP